jgi:hypothetical protein
VSGVATAEFKTESQGKREVYSVTQCVAIERTMVEREVYSVTQRVANGVATYAGGIDRSAQMRGFEVRRGSTDRMGPFFCNARTGPCTPVLHDSFTFFSSIVFKNSMALRVMP